MLKTGYVLVYHFSKKQKAARQNEYTRRGEENEVLHSAPKYVPTPWNHEKMDHILCQKTSKHLPLVTRAFSTYPPRTNFHGWVLLHNYQTAIYGRAVGCKLPHVLYVLVRMQENYIFAFLSVRLERFSVMMVFPATQKKGYPKLPSEVLPLHPRH